MVSLQKASKIRGNNSEGIMRGELTRGRAVFD
jgi:hypothetical protein